MHFICSTFGSSGDVFPMLGLALELRKRDHDVTFATNPNYEELAAKYEIPFKALGSREQFAECINHPDLWHPQRAFRHVFHCLKSALKQQYDLHAKHADSSTVGITNCFGFGAFMAQDKVGLPVLTLHCQPSVIWSDRKPPKMPGLFGPNWLRSIQFRIGERFFLDPVVCPFVNEWRRELDLPPIKRVTRFWNSQKGVICLFPEWFCPPQNDWPGNLVQTDFPLWNDRSGQELAEDVQSFLGQGEPPLVFTPGSTNLHGQRFFLSAVEACQQLDRRGIFLTEYPDQLPSLLPKNIAHFRYVPLDLLLPQSAAFIHHGGIGSTSQGMAAGVPQVLMPLAHDQFDNAERVKNLGVGDWIIARRFTGPRLARKLGDLLESEAVAAACREVAEKLTPKNGLSRAAEAIERKVGGSRLASPEPVA